MLVHSHKVHAVHAVPCKPCCAGQDVHAAHATPAALLTSWSVSGCSFSGASVSTSANAMLRVLLQTPWSLCTSGDKETTRVQV